MKRAFISLILIGSLWAQLGGVPKSLEFSPNSSSIFGVMGLSPSQVNTFGSAKDFHVDWVLANGTVSPNIAIEMNPIWFLAFRGVSYMKYTNMNYFVRHILGEAKLSVGNALADGTKGKVGLALKFNLYQQADPLNDRVLASNLEPKNLEERRKLVDQITMLQLMKIYKTNSGGLNVDSSIAVLKAKLEDIEIAETLRIKGILTNYATRNWNKAYVDVGYGFYMDYLLDGTNNYASFVATSTNSVIWIAAGFGIGKFAQVSFLDRYNINTTNMLAGINIKLGTLANKNGFLEYCPTFNLGSTNVIQSHLINFGGTYQFNPKFTLTLGLKVTYETALPKPWTLTPAVNVAFLL